MTNSWMEAALFCLILGLAWGFYKEYSDHKKAEDRTQPFKPKRAIILGLFGALAGMAGLSVLSLLDLTNIG